MDDIDKEYLKTLSGIAKIKFCYWLYTSELKRWIQMYMNEFRRYLVNKLLGRELILMRIKAPSGNKVRFIDEKRRLNYGEWEVIQVNERNFKLSR